MLYVIILMGISCFVIFYAMIGYPITLLLIDKISENDSIKKDYNYEPAVTYMIVAHNEEDVIYKKMENALELDYPKEKLQILIASDYSTDKTDAIVEKFVNDNQDYNIILYRTLEHKGKTNAQNEAVGISIGEIVVMTDANAILNRNAIRELVASFTSDDIVYVCGRLEYSNIGNETSESESKYWNLDLKMRDIESRIQTITAGNGSIYAVRKKEYIITPLIRCHDGYLPFQYALKEKRCIFNPDAVSYEKAGEDNRDEFKRKVRMNRTILEIFNSAPKVMNPLKYKWFSLFYFGHRTCRYLLWLMHIIFFGASIVLLFLCQSVIAWLIVIAQVIGLGLGIASINHQFRNKYIRMIGYYSMTVIAQMVAAFKQITGQTKATWEKAESTR